MGVRPGRIEIHVNGQRTCTPDGKYSKERHPFTDKFLRQPERNKKAEKSVERGAKRHRETVRRRKTVGGDRGTQGSSEEDTGVRNQQKGRPKDRWADGKVVVEMTGGSAKFRARLSGLIEASLAKTGIGVLIVRRKIEVPLNQQRTGVGVVAHTVAANPGVAQRK